MYVVLLTVRRSLPGQWTLWVVQDATCCSIQVHKGTQQTAIITSLSFTWPSPTNCTSLLTWICSGTNLLFVFYCYFLSSS